MIVFRIEYRVIGYKLSDGMRLNPKWGKKAYTVKSDDIGSEDIRQVVIASQHPDNVPNGYKLFSVENIATGEMVMP